MKTNLDTPYSMRARLIVFFVFLLCVSGYQNSASAQNSDFYKGLNYYLSSKYRKAAVYFSLAENSNADTYKADIYYLNGLCLYYSQNYQQAIQKFDLSMQYWCFQETKQTTNYFDMNTLLRYKVLTFEKLKNTDEQIAVLNEMVSEYKSTWAQERLKTFQKSQE